VVGIHLDREAIMQVESGELIDFVEQAQPGDLAFFENTRGKIDHVGILIPGQKVIHAHGFVRIDKLDHYGIYNEEEQRYTHRLRVLRRVLPPEEETDTGLNRSEALDTQQYELF
jgi:cell wall-associated NlpC family hydrolase